MAGSKGMEWRNKLQNPTKINTSIEQAQLNKIKDVCNERVWHVGKVVREMVNFAIEYMAEFMEYVK